MACGKGIYRKCLLNAKRLLCTQSNPPANMKHVAIVGSGPSGFYTAQNILKGNPDVRVDIYEKLPVPFGLVRFGVAPDHPEVKNVINTFTQTANLERCKFFGHVSIGKDVTLKHLREAYDAVVLAYGADKDKMFGIPGEDLQGVHAARSFVGWYNGLPENQDLNPNLDVDTAVVLGMGNVALDVARVLLTPIDILRKTDITEYAVESLLKSRINRVFLVGRRGPLQVAFTIAELREMIKLPGNRPLFSKHDFEGLEKYVNEIPRPRKRLTELMIKTALEEPSEKDSARWSQAKKEWSLRFLRSPLEMLSTDGTTVSGIRLGINTLEGPIGQQQKAVAIGKTEDLSCGLVLRSIGYQSIPLENNMPFDTNKWLIPNINGRVTGEPGLYCSGWVKRGPIGVIVSTMNDAFETGKVVVEDLKKDLVESRQKAGSEAIIQYLHQKGIKPMSFDEWNLINEVEKERGQPLDKPRCKISSIEEMLKIARLK